MDRAAVLKTGSIVVLSVNLSLFVYKLLIGMYIHSYALVSDSFNSMTDALVGLSMFAGITYAYRPPDEAHAFGHGRAEYIVLFVLAATLIGTGVAILAGEYFDREHLAEVRYSLLYVVMIAITIPVKFFLGTYVARIGRERSAEFMSADYWHEQSDNLVTGAVIIGIIVSGQGYYFVDPAIGAAIAAFLIYLGISYGRKSVNQLMGGYQNRELIDKARIASIGVNGVRDTGSIEIHEYGERVVVNVTIVLSEDLDAPSAHKISHMVQDALMENGFYSAHVHVDTRKTALIDDVEKSLRSITSQVDQVLSFHGLEIRESLGTSIAEVHLVFRKDITLENAHRIAHEIDERFRVKFPDFQLLTHIEPQG